MPEPPPVPLIATVSELSSLCEHLRAAGRFAFDTEFVSEQTYEPVLCLLQVATVERVAVIDPLAVRDLDPIWDVLFDPSIEVVMHAAGEDLRITRHQTGSVPARVFDVQLVAGLVGHSYPLSLGNLVGQVVGVNLAGGETRTDWRRRPLSAAQLRYAADDVRHLLEVADHLKGRLDHLGRASWAEDELADFLHEIRSRNEEDRWRRLPGLHHLNRRGLEIARRLSEWRAEDARGANRPLRHLLRDDLLVAIAKRSPRSRRDLETLRDFQRPALLSRSSEVLERVEQAMEVPPELLPEHQERFEDAPGATMVASLLSAALNQCCTISQVAPGLVGSTSDLKDLIRWYGQGLDHSCPPSLLQGWRGEVCGQVLVDVLAGRRSLRVIDPIAEVPVALDPIAEEPSPSPGT